MGARGLSGEEAETLIHKIALIAESKTIMQGKQLDAYEAPKSSV
jgi:hypothetical protein